MVDNLYWSDALLDCSYYRWKKLHFEHTVAVTDNGYDILTITPDYLPILKEKYPLVVVLTLFQI